MSEALKIRVEPRDSQKNVGTGTRVARRLRKSGRVPAVIYGHKQAVAPITLGRDDVARMVKGPGRLAELDLGDKTETVLIREVQWDHLGKEVMHLDFARVDVEEIIETEVPVEIKGHLSGNAAGGLLEHLVHSLNVRCRAGAIPTSLKVDISPLELDQGIHVRDLALPEGVTVDADADLLLVQVVTRAVAAEPAAEAAATEGAQPEVIKPDRKEKEKEG